MSLCCKVSGCLCGILEYQEKTLLALVVFWLLFWALLFPKSSTLCFFFLVISWNKYICLAHLWTCWAWEWEVVHITSLLFLGVQHPHRYKLKGQSGGYSEICFYRKSRCGQGREEEILGLSGEPEKQHYFKAYMYFN